MSEEEKMVEIELELDIEIYLNGRKYIPKSAEISENKMIFFINDEDHKDCRCKSEAECHCNFDVE